MNEIDIKHACSFTGHRPEKLGMAEDVVIAWLEKQIRKAVDDGYTDFISGMQRGVDIWAAEIVLKLILDGAKIHLICACAWNGMEKDWEPKWRQRYTSLLIASDKTVYVGKRPGTQAYIDRDYWMVDHSSRLIGVYTGAPGGTKKTVWYAKEKGLEVITIKGN
ncbi:MAG: DUF1273 family protein [Clostridiales bacterium]|nr:DUF1273 family protein [Clostridiales bacterium]